MDRPWRWIFASLALLFAALGLVVVRQQREISRLRTNLSSQGAQLASNQSQVEALAGRLATEQQGRLAAGQALRRTAAENTRLADALGLDAGDLSYWRGERLQEAGRRYAAELARLDLSPDQRNALLGLLADRTDAMRDAREIALREGIAADSAEMALAIQNAAADVDADIRGAIGGAVDGFFPAAPAPVVTVAVYNPPAVVVPVYTSPPPAESSAPADYAPAPEYTPYAPVLFVSNFRSGERGRPQRFAGPRSEPRRTFRSAPPPAAASFGRVLPLGSRVNSFR